MTGRWVRAIELGELARQGQACVRLEGRAVALFFKDGSVYACADACPHEGYPLSELGEFDGACVLTCAMHNYRYDLRTGASVFGGATLLIYATEVRGADVWVDLAAAAK